MKAIYKPRGAALEYGPWAVNLYQGCSHGCTYCYTPAVLHKSREEFKADCGPRKGIVEALTKDLLTFTGKSLFFCFTCDPWQKEQNGLTTTRALIQCIPHKVRPILLTKNPLNLLDIKDILISADAIIGTTITTIDAQLAAKYEPNAPPPEERLRGLMYAKALGLRTWVSIEPLLVPEELPAILSATWLIADRIKVGRWNHDAAADKLNWQGALGQCHRCFPIIKGWREKLGGADFGWHIKDALLRSGTLEGIPTKYGKDLWE